MQEQMEKPKEEKKQSEGKPPYKGKKKGRKAIILGKILDMFIMPEPKKDYEHGISIAEISMKLYGKNDYYSKNKARQMISALRRRVKAMMYERMGTTTAFTLFSSRPEVSTEKGIKIGERRYFIHDDIHNLLRKMKEFNKIQNGIQKTKNDVDRRMVEIEAKENLDMPEKLQKISKGEIDEN